MELAIRNGTVVTASGSMRCDVGVEGGRVALLAERIEGAREEIDAQGLLVLPGGVDTHCHIEQPEADGTVHEDSFATATASALAGGTTSVISFSPQFRGQPIAATLPGYRKRAEAALCDYSFHQIITDPTDTVLREEIPALVESGIRSLKVFMTYDPLHVDDRGLLRVLAAARANGALVTVHCENYAAISMRMEALLAAGMSGPKYHAWARPKVVEREATHRAIALAALMDQPIQVFHVSCAEVADEISRAQARGQKVWGETCTQYFTLTAAHMDRPGFEGAKFMCSPAPRDAADQEQLWNVVRAGTLDVISSDHCGYSFEGTKGKRLNGSDAPFPRIPNGIPGIAARLPLVFSEGVAKGRISVEKFVDLVATQPARLFGLERKGRIAVGADADIVLWDAKRQVTLTNSLMQHAIDYTPYEGIKVTGWPTMTLSRGEVVMRDGAITAAPRRGRFIARGPYDAIRPTGRFPHGFDMGRHVVG
jgi:dihydropyrimidinase